MPTSTDGTCRPAAARRSDLLDAAPLSLVSVSIRNEEKAGKYFVATLELFDGCWINANDRHPLALAVKILTAMAVAIAIPLRTGLFPTLIPGLFNFNVVLIIAQVDQGKVREVEPMANLEFKASA